MSSHYTTYISTLPATTPLDHPDLCDHVGGATHVVTSLKYGMEAHATLMKRFGEEEGREKKREVFMKLQEAVRRIPALARDGG